MKIDIFPHIYPKRFAERVLSLSSAGLYMQKRFREIPVLTDLDLRFRIMDRYGDYVQVLTLSSPPIEAMGTPEETPELARLANDGMAALVEKYPDRFPGFVASLPMNNPEVALREMDRAVTGLGATGVQIFSNVNGRPLDEAEFQPLFAGMAAFNLPVWLHPARSPDFPDYQTEKRSRYDFWWVFGWPYETTIAMGRLVFSGIFDQHPDLMIIAHHMGAMIPFFEGRAGSGLDQLGSRTEDPDDAVALGPPSSSPARLLPAVLRRHRAVRGPTRPGMRACLLRRRSRPLRHRHAVRSREGAGLHSGDDPVSRGNAGLLRGESEDLRGERPEAPQTQAAVGGQEGGLFITRVTPLGRDAIRKI